MNQSRWISGELLIVLSAFIWGVAFYFQKTAMIHVGPMLFIGLRGCIAALVLLPFAFVETRGRRNLYQRAVVNNPVDDQVAIDHEQSIYPIALVGGFTFFIAAALQQVGIVTATVTNTGFLTALYVVVTPFLFWLIRRRRPAGIIWISAGVAVTGVWALGGGSLSALSSGDRLVAVSSIFWALLIVVSGEAGKHQLPMTYTAVQFFVVGCLGFVAAIFFETISIEALISALPAVLYVAVLSTALTFGLMAIALQTVAAPTASILLATETLFAAMAGHLWLGERLSMLGWIGASLILVAIVSLQLDKRD